VRLELASQSAPSSSPHEDELLEQIALRVRHSAAIRLLETVPDQDARVSLLCDVVAPPAAFEQASLEAARGVLEHRLAGGSGPARRRFR